LYCARFCVLTETLMHVHLCGCFYPLGKTRHLEGGTLDTERTSWWWHLWRVETCRKFTNVWCVHISSVFMRYVSM